METIKLTWEDKNTTGQNTDSYRVIDSNKYNVRLKSSVIIIVIILTIITFGGGVAIGKFIKGTNNKSTVDNVVKTTPKKVEVQKKTNYDKPKSINKKETGSDTESDEETITSEPTATVVKQPGSSQLTPIALGKAYNVDGWMIKINSSTTINYQDREWPYWNEDGFNNINGKYLLIEYSAYRDSDGVGKFEENNVFYLINKSGPRAQAKKVNVIASGNNTAEGTVCFEITNIPSVLSVYGDTSRGYFSIFK